MTWSVITRAYRGGGGMVASVTAVLKRLTTEWATPVPPEALIAACEEAGDSSWRDRGLTPLTTIPLFL
jgi:hypothetical protein